MKYIGEVWKKWFQFPDYKPAFLSITHCESRVQTSLNKHLSFWSIFLICNESVLFYDFETYLISHTTFIVQQNRRRERSKTKQGHCQDRTTTGTVKICYISHLPWNYFFCEIQLSIFTYFQDEKFKRKHLLNTMKAFSNSLWTIFI